MHKGYLFISVILFVLSISCIVSTVVEIIQKKYGMVSWDFRGGVIFHLVTAFIAVLLLYKARKAK